jgi:hypothetical protein
VTRHLVLTLIYYCIITEEDMCTFGEFLAIFLTTHLSRLWLRLYNIEILNCSLTHTDIVGLRFLSSYAFADYSYVARISVLYSTSPSNHVDRDSSVTFCSSYHAESGD